MVKNAIRSKWLKRIYFVFGTVDKYKGVDLLVDAYCNLTCKSLKLVIAGRGFDIETHNENIIRINRFIEDEEVAYLLKRQNLLFILIVLQQCQGYCL